MMALPLPRLVRFAARDDLAGMLPCRSCARRFCCVFSGLAVHDGLAVDVRDPSLIAPVINGFAVRSVVLHLLLRSMALLTLRWMALLMLMLLRVMDFFSLAGASARLDFFACWPSRCC